MMILPKKTSEGKPYLSYSQIAKWKRNKNDYFKTYFFERGYDKSTYLDFGIKVGEALEHNNFSGFTVKEVETLKKVPRLDVFEKEIKLNMGDFSVVGHIDSVSKDLSTLIDYKTMGGEDKIPEYTKPEYIQLIIYAMGIEQETGVRPKEIKVIGVERLGAFRDEKVVGGEIYDVPLELNQDRIDYATEVINQTAKEISAHYKVFLKMREYF